MRHSRLRRRRRRGLAVRLTCDFAFANDGT
jgi:hypothetical protein